MKKAILIIVCIVACCVLLANADMLNNFASALATGAVVPLVIAVILMLVRHLTQAESYQTAFSAIGFDKTTLWDNVVLIFSIVFINTFCLFGGATGVAFIVDDLHRKGASLGTATSGAILSQVGYFAAIFVISVIGFITMTVSGTVNVLFVVGGLLLAGTLAILSSMFIIGYFKPDLLYRLFDFLDRWINKIIAHFHRSLPAAWGSATADSIIKSARILAHNPQGTAVTVSWASLSAITNMLCLVAVGFAFGYTNVPVLVAAFALSAISVILSPTPQGVGVVEAVIIAAVAGGGGDAALGATIALVYRGIMFWIPFGIGALLLSQTDFFVGKKNPSLEQKAKDIGWIAGTLVGIVGLVNIGLNFIPSLFEPYQALVEWISFGDLFMGPTLIVVGIALLVLAVGLVMRFRTAWAITEVLLVLVAAAEFLFYDTIKVAIVVIALAVWLYARRQVFDQLITPDSIANMEPPKLPRRGKKEEPKGK
ncbi:MAG: lysylphosphatidylglycerol synthase domain-containing protein [Eggerthellaceae bacterium]|jgi:phosphatidylglycerol lysyltransferase